MNSGTQHSEADTHPDEEVSRFAFLVGTTLDSRYRIDDVLGSGGMGAVFLATQLSIEREVAVKVIIPDGEIPQDLKERFWREARVMSGLSHPNIVQLYDYGESESLVYLVMELVEGVLLSDLLERGRLEPRVTCELLYQLAHALVESHDKGVVHRDLKPGNMLLTVGADSRLTLKVFDFGIAYPKESEVKVTKTGLLCGTPVYMSPEHIRGQEVTASSDLYSAGVCAFEMLIGRVPFDGQTLQLLFQHVQEPPPSLDEYVVSGEIPAALVELIGELLAKTPQQRVGSALEFLKRVERLREGPMELEGRDPESALSPFVLPPLEAGRASREVRLQAARRAQESPSEPFHHAADEVKGAWKAFLEHDDDDDGSRQQRPVDPNVEHYEYIGSTHKFEAASVERPSNHSDSQVEVDLLDQAGELDLSSISSSFPTTAKYKAIESSQTQAESMPPESSDSEEKSGRNSVSKSPASSPAQRSPAAPRVDESKEPEQEGSFGKHMANLLLVVGGVGVLVALLTVMYFIQSVGFAPEEDTMTSEELEEYQRRTDAVEPQEVEPQEVKPIKVNGPELRKRKKRESSQSARPKDVPSGSRVIDIWDDDEPDGESNGPVKNERIR